MQPPRTAAPVAERSFPATLGNVWEIVSFVTGFASESGLPAAKIERLDVAVEEWATNVCRHAYRGEGGTLWVVVRRGEQELVVEMIDEGSPFDPTTAKDPDISLPLKERIPGGLGLMMIRRMVDGLRYQREGERNVVSLTVHP